MRTHPLFRGALVVGAALFVGCTFGGLGDYEIESCDPRVTSADEDVCRRLETSDPCQPYQCGPSGTCVQGPRDADRDGDPDLACGGTDCDDANRVVSGIVTEVCDQLDNDCNALVDEGVLMSGSRVEVDNLGVLSTDQRDGVSMGGGGAPDSEIVGASVIDHGGECIRAVRLPGSAPEGCSLFGSETVSPRQPYAQRMASQTGAVVVSVSGCAHGRLMYRVGPNPANTAGPSDQTCEDANPGAALPALAPMPGSANALVAWYRADVRQRDDRYGSCQQAAPVPLVIARMNDARTGSPTLGESIELVSDATSVAPPAAIPVTSAGGVLLLSPVGESAAAWWVSGDLSGLQEPAWIHGFAGARAISAAIREADGLVHVLAVGELGCLPQSLRISMGTLDGSGVLTFGEATELVPSQPNVLVGRPAAQWVPSREEWQVTWVASGPTVMAQRLGADGKKIGEPFEVAAGASLAATVSDGTVYAFEPGTDSNVFWEVPVGCGP